MSQVITVHKLDERGRPVWSYQGRLLVRGPHHLTLAAAFDRDRTEAGPLTIERGDRFVETFYDDRWYNVFAVHSSDGTVFRGWYCNIARPAILTENDVRQEDLALDLIVLPDGQQAVLDRHEFEALTLDEHERSQAGEALADLQARAAQRQPPFDRPPERIA